MANDDPVKLGALVEDEQGAGVHGQGFGGLGHHQLQGAIQVVGGGDLAAGFADGDQSLGPFLLAPGGNGQLALTLALAGDKIAKQGANGQNGDQNGPALLL